MRMNAGRKGASSSAATVPLDRNVRNSRTFARSCVRRRRDCWHRDRAFKHDGSDAGLESDCEATEQPAAQSVKRRAKTRAIAAMKVRPTSVSTLPLLSTRSNTSMEKKGSTRSRTLIDTLKAAIHARADRPGINPGSDR